MKPKIVAVATSFNDAILAKKYSADIIELRIDLFKNRNLIDIVKLSKKRTKLPIIATIRSKFEGGEFRGNELTRFSLFRQVLPYVDFIDIELSSKIIKNLINIARNKKIIISYHNFKNTPPEKKLEQIISRASGYKPYIIKIATLVKRKSDLLRLFALLNNQSKKYSLAIIPMGSKGQSGRILAPILGSALNYAFVKNTVSPGQISLKSYVKYFKKSSSS